MVECNNDLWGLLVFLRFWTCKENLAPFTVCRKQLNVIWSKLIVKLSVSVGIGNLFHILYLKSMKNVMDFLILCDVDAE